MDNPEQKAIKEKGAALRLRLSNNWQNFRERMHHKHRIVVMDTDTFKETFSAELTGVNIFTYVGITVIVMLILASLLIAFTPLRGLVPGFIKPELREETIRNARTIDSLELVIDQHEQHIRIIQDVINGKTITTAETTPAETIDEQEIVYRRSRADSLLRVKVEKRRKEQQGKNKNKRKK
ncbi:MAG: hypothetical protein IJ785_07850 [Bacteroidales bacterium]|nr:hypothetical protein [Bacteroidales bacterium]